jgi:ketosteroid isomerase-like protein
MPDAIDDLFRRFGKAFNKADVEEIAACVTDDFEWRLAAGARPSGTVLKGKGDLRRYFADKSQAHREARYSEARIHRGGDKLFRHLPRHRHRCQGPAVRPLRHRPLRTQGRQDRAQGQLPEGRLSGLVRERQLEARAKDRQHLAPLD